jgi:hypothetical protein
MQAIGVNLMSEKHTKAQDIASKYRVIKINDGVFNLRRREDPSSTGFDVERQSIRLYIDTAPATLTWIADAYKAPFYIAHLNVLDLSIGYRGEEGWSSALAENSIFVIDGEEIQHLPLNNIRVLSAENYQEEQIRIAKDKECIALLKGKSELRNDEISKNRFASATLTHVPEALLECSVGLPQAIFDKLVESSLSNRATKVSLIGGCGALSSSFRYGTARDMLILADTSVSIHIDSIAIQSQSITMQEQADSVATDDEIYLKDEGDEEEKSNKLATSLGQVSINILNLRNTIIQAVWIISIVVLVVILIK